MKIKIKMNNIVLHHRGHVISVARHFEGDRVTCSELLVWGENVDEVTVPFTGTLESLEGALAEARALIEKEGEA